MLNIRFDRKGKWNEDQIIVAAPYELVSGYIGSEIQASPSGAKYMADLLRAVIKGTHAPLDYEIGNAWAIDADPEWVTLTHDFAWSQPSVRLPTKWLVDALEQWREYLIGCGVHVQQ